MFRHIPLSFDDSSSWIGTPFAYVSAQLDRVHIASEV